MEAAKNSAAPNVNVTPLIDVLLVLLIIFMVAAPLRPSRFRASVPEPPPEDPRVRPSPRTLVVSIEGDGRLKLIRGLEAVAEASVAEPGAVVARLAEEWAERAARGSWKLALEGRADVPAAQRIERTVFIRAPRLIHYGEVVKVIDKVKGAGAQPIGLQTDELPN